MSALVAEASRTDPVALTFAATMLAAVALAACFVPALRATRIAPMVALRE